MQVVIDDNQRIDKIQGIFAEKFPYLKLEFFSVPHASVEGTPEEPITSIQKTIGQCRHMHTTGNLFITPQMTVINLEQQFQARFGLSVRVFRKSGNVWLETTVTHSWTLKKQNEQGYELSDMERLNVQAYPLRNIPLFKN